jgi:hypothetical protein
MTRNPLKALREREFLAEEEAAERLWRRAEGVCVGCGEPVTLGCGGRGSCVWRGGRWHPDCRARDRASGGTMWKEGSK